MKDMYKNMCVQQGYVPSTCTMDWELCWLLVNNQGNPCISCNADKSICKTKNNIS